jgi:hypothetical protein
VIIHGDMDVVVADPASADPLAAAVQPPAAAVGNAAQLLDIDVDQLAGLVALVTAARGAPGAQPGAGDRVQVAQERDLVAAQDAPDGGRAGPELGGQPDRPPPGRGPQREDLGFAGWAGPVGLVRWGWMRGRLERSSSPAAPSLA